MRSRVYRTTSSTVVSRGSTAASTPTSTSKPAYAATSTAVTVRPSSPAARRRGAVRRYPRLRRPRPYRRRSSGGRRRDPRGRVPSPHGVREPFNEPTSTVTRLHGQSRSKATFSERICDLIPDTAPADHDGVLCSTRPICRGRHGRKCPATRRPATVTLSPAQFSSPHEGSQYGRRGPVLQTWVCRNGPVFRSSDQQLTVRQDLIDHLDTGLPERHDVDLRFERCPGRRVSRRDGGSTRHVDREPRRGARRSARIETATPRSRSPTATVAERVDLRRPDYRSGGV